MSEKTNKTDVQKTKLPKWLQVFYIISGMINLSYATIVLLNIKFGYLIISTLFGIALLTIGLTRILVGLFDKRQEKSLAILNLLTGFLLIPIGLIAINKEDITLKLVLIFIAIAFLLLGYIEIVKGFQEKTKESIIRFLLILYGVFLISAAIFDLAMDDIAHAVIVTLLTSGFIVLGIRRLVDGVYSVKILKKIKEKNSPEKSCG
ncbi:MAG: DUF308 domain-containing protein [Candidatus Heimdallarchaeota archaeon]|nr:DUF308 domain-containing protein [Candidatus Heimdallarchaeota archaeon]